jgi:hypothetical protein
LESYPSHSFPTLRSDDALIQLDNGLTGAIRMK